MEEKTLTPKQIVEHLKRIPLFQKLSGERGELELYHIAKAIRLETYAKGAWLFSQADMSDRLYYILEGQVRLSRVDREGITHQLAERIAEDSMGVTGLMVGDFHDVTAEAVNDVQALTLMRQDFNELLQTHPYLRRHLMLPAEILRRKEIPRFDWLREDEWVVMAVRRHWAHIIRKVAPPMALFILLLLVFPYLALSTFPVYHWLAILIGITLVTLSAFLGWQYLNWRDDFFVLTTQRVVHLEKIWPFRLNFEESPLENIEDVYQVQPGPAAGILNFGNLILQTAGETVQIDMDRVPDPDYLRTMIFREIERIKAREVLNKVGAMREVLARRLNIVQSEPPVKIEAKPPARIKSPVTLFLNSIWEYFFPSSWLPSEDGTTIIWRRHWFPGFMRYLRILTPLTVLTLLGGAFLTSRWGQPGTEWLFVLWLIIEAVLFGWLLWFVEDWRNDYFQITPNRIILVNAKPLLLRSTRREASLDRIQNISFEVPGALANIIGYGHVVLETAGTLGRFELKWLRNPQKVQEEISKRQRQYTQRQKKAEAQRQQDELLGWFSTYDSLRQEQIKKSK